MSDSIVTNPYMLASVISVQNTISPARKEIKADVVELAGKVLGACGFFYTIGSVSLNTTEYFREFHPLSLSHPSYLFAGVWAVLFFGIACLLFVGALTIDRRFLHLRRHPQRWYTGCFTAYLSALLLLIFLPSTQSDIHEIILAVLVLAVGGLGLILLTSSLRQCQVASSTTKH